MRTQNALQFRLHLFLFWRFYKCSFNSLRHLSHRLNKFFRTLILESHSNRISLIHCWKLARAITNHLFRINLSDNSFLLNFSNEATNSCKISAGENEETLTNAKDGQIFLSHFSNYPSRINESTLSAALKSMSLFRKLLETC